MIPQIEPLFSEREKQALIECMDSTWITEAERTREFEKRIADFLGVKYCVATTSGSVALYLALKSLDIGVGDEVIVPDVTMVATIEAVKLCGAKPVLVDIDPKTLCINIDEMILKITPKTRAIVPVHINGRACNMDFLVDMCTDYGIKLVEDASQAFSSKFYGNYLGTYGNLGCFSLSTPKIITTSQGGLVVTEDQELYEKLVRLKDHGRLSRKETTHPYWGFNFKFNDLLASVGLAQLENLDWRIKRKKGIYELYMEHLEGLSGIETVKTDLEDVTPWFVDILVNNREQLIRHLWERQIGTLPFYEPLHTQPPYKTKGKFENATKISERGLWLPSSLTLKDLDIITICKQIEKWIW